MKVTFTGNLDELVPAQRKKLDRKLAKLGKLVDGKEEKEAHIIVNSERQNHRAEITVHFHNHALVGIGSAPDLLTALTAAIDKLEKQIQKLRTKWRDTKRVPEQSLRSVSAAESEEAAEEEFELVTERKVFRANHRADQKPLTLEEALLAMEDGRDYLVYRDADTDRLSVLLRRRDGHFDLVEA
jgi:putative sigma-54 modulation protein